MEEFLTYILTNIVKFPDDVSIEEELSGNTYVYKITVNPEDMGLVIGKEGRSIKSLRALARSKAIKEGIMINVELVEPEQRSTPEIKQTEKPAESVDDAEI